MAIIVELIPKKVYKDALFSGDNIALLRSGDTSGTGVEYALRAYPWGIVGDYDSLKDGDIIFLKGLTERERKLFDSACIDGDVFGCQIAKRIKDGVILMPRQEYTSTHYLPMSGVSGLFRSNFNIKDEFMGGARFKDVLSDGFYEVPLPINGCNLFNRKDGKWSYCTYSSDWDPLLGYSPIEKDVNCTSFMLFDNEVFFKNGGDFANLGMLPAERMIKDRSCFTSGEEYDNISQDVNAGVTVETGWFSLQDWVNSLNERNTFRVLDSTLGSVLGYYNWSTTGSNMYALYDVSNMEENLSDRRVCQFNFGTLATSTRVNAPWRKSNTFQNLTDMRQKFLKTITSYLLSQPAEKTAGNTDVARALFLKNLSKKCKEEAVGQVGFGLHDPYRDTSDDWD